jgi:hypothetical protein
MAIALDKARKLANRTTMFPDLPRVMAIALGKGIILPSAILARSRQRIFKKGKNFFTESLPGRISANIF